MNEYQCMLRDVQMLDFALQEAALFLDNHTQDQRALEYFNHVQKLAEAARAAFENTFGPLQYQNQQDINCWQWADGPWPWECED